MTPWWWYCCGYVVGFTGAAILGVLDLRHWRWGAVVGVCAGVLFAIIATLAA